MTGQHHKIRKVTNAGTWLCSYVPETKNVVVSEHYTLKTSHSQPGVLKMPTSTILLELVLGDQPDDFVDVLPGFVRVERWEPISVYRRHPKCICGDRVPSGLPLIGYKQDLCWSRIELKRL